MQRRQQPLSWRKKSKATIESWEGVDEALFESLRKFRRELAAARGVPPYIILGDRSLRDVLDTARGTHATTRAQIAALAQGIAAPSADAFLADVPGYADHYEQHHGWIRALVVGR